MKVLDFKHINIRDLKDLHDNIWGNGSKFHFSNHKEEWLNIYYKRGFDESRCFFD